MYIEKSYMYYYYSYFNVAIPMLNGNANKDCCCFCCNLSFPDLLQHSKPVDNKFWQSTCNKSVNYNLRQTSLTRCGKPCEHILVLACCNKSVAGCWQTCCREGGRSIIGGGGRYSYIRVLYQ